MTTRLDFRLPAFTRRAWVSDHARAVWEPRFAEIARAWREIEWQTVAAGRRGCALLWLSHDELAALAPRLHTHGLRASTLQSSLRPAGEKGDPTLVHRVAIGSRRALGVLRKAWLRGDDDEVGRSLGYPACCRAFFRKALVQERWLDPTWPRAARWGDGPVLEVAVEPELNLFLSSLGVRLVPHEPCSFNCPEARQVAEGFIATGRQAGFEAPLDRAAEALRWPVEWSALHGIAEIRTPIVKLSMRTDAVAEKRIVRHHGAGYPLEGAQGAGFPYALRPAPAKQIRQAPILQETMAALEARRGIEGRRIVGIHLSTYFTLVETDNGSVGACMSYYQLNAAVIRDVQRLLEGALPHDPLLQNFLATPGGALASALRATIVSALSARFLRSSGDDAFAVGDDAPYDMFGGVRRALVVGFGGYMERLADHPSVEALYVTDLSYDRRRVEMDEKLAEYRQRHPHKRFVVSDGSDAAALFKQVDAAFITGSALCNGTLDDLLPLARPCPRVVIQGQSASILPVALFARGVDLAVTTLKPPTLLRDARSLGGEAKLRSAMESGSSQIYLYPKGRHAS